MNAQQIIASHKNWKDRFRIAMATREPLNLAQVSADNCCEFGHWLYGEGQARFGGTAEYETCRRQHALFHQEAAKVAACINAGQLLEADRMLASSTPYAKVSEALGMAVIALFLTEGHTTATLSP